MSERTPQPTPPNSAPRSDATRLLRLELALRNAEMGVVELRLNENTVVLHESALELYEVSHSSAPVSLGSLIGRVHPAERARVAEAIEEARRGGELETVRFRMADERDRRWFELRGERAAQLGTEVLLGTVRDITSEVEAELSLQRSEQTFRMLIERMPDAIVVLQDGRAVYCNPAFRRLLGAGVDASEISIETMLPISITDQAFVTGRQTEFCRPDGTFVPVDLTSFTMLYLGELAQLVLLRDLTDRHALTARMMRLDRMVAIGSLAAGVGHEINNPLAFMLANIDYAQSVFASEFEVLADCRARLTDQADANYLDRIDQALVSFEEVSDALETIQQGALRVRNIVRELKALAQENDSDDDSPTVVADALESAISMVSSRLHGRARLIRAYEETPAVSINEGVLVQVLVNLLLNALDALPEGASQDHCIQITTRYQDNQVIIDIEDTGRGIPPESLAKVFDPFFTTKPPNRGTGMGLPISQALIHRIGGELELSNRRVRGVRARLTLPVASRQRVHPRLRTAIIPRTDGRLLIVDDDSNLLVSLARYLQHEYHVDTTLSPQQALDLIAAGAQFDALLVKLTMPTMTGRRFLEQLSSIAPDVVPRVIFLTDGTGSPSLRQYAENLPNALIEKPFTRDEVLGVIEQVLNGQH